jgi:hypothetical protein
VGFFWFQEPYDAGRLVIANVASGRHGWLTRQGRHDHMPAWSRTES